jgi:hypothetical protein
MAGEAAEGPARSRPDHAVRGQTVLALKAHHGRGRRRPDDTVDWAAVDMVMAKRHLEGHNPGIVQLRALNVS